MHQTLDQTLQRLRTETPCAERMAPNFSRVGQMTSEHGEVYWIVSGARNYIGASKDVDRRLKQHNRLLSGGAGQTAGGCWSVCCTVRGFASWVECLQFEMAFKRASRGKTRAQRRQALENVVAEDRWRSSLVVRVAV